MLVSEYATAIVRRIAANGTISTWAGTAVKAYAGDGGPARAAAFAGPHKLIVGADGSVLVADRPSNTVRRVDGATGVVTRFAGAPGTSVSTIPWGNGSSAPRANLGNSASAVGPAAVAVTRSGDLYVADPGLSVIWRLDAVTGVVTLVAGALGAGYNGDGPATSTQLSGPRAIALGPDETQLYICDTGNHLVRVLDLVYGWVSTLAGQGTVSGLGGDGGDAGAAVLTLPAGVAVDANGTVYISDTGNGRLRVVNATTRVITTVAGGGCVLPLVSTVLRPLSAKLPVLTHIALDPSGRGLYMADQPDTWTGVVHRYNLSTGMLESPIGGLTLPSGLAVNPRGDVFVSETYFNYVLVMNATRTGTPVPAAGISWSSPPPAQRFSGDGGPALAATFYLSSTAASGGLAVHPSGDVLVADDRNLRVRRFTRGGNVSTVLGPQSATDVGDGLLAGNVRVAVPSGLAQGADGAVYVAAQLAVFRVDPASGVATLLAGGPVQAPSTAVVEGQAGATAMFKSIGGLAWCRRNGTDFLIVADTLGYRVRAINMSSPSMEVTTLAGTGTAGNGGTNVPAATAPLMQPGDLACAADGTVYVSDSHCVRRVDAGGMLTTFAGACTTSGNTGDGGAATSARLSFSDPSTGGGIALTPDGARLYIAGACRRCARVAHARARTPGAGERAAAGPPTSPARTPAADSNNLRLRVVNVRTGVITAVAGGATCGLTFNAPQRVVVGTVNGTVVVADTSSHALKAVNASSGVQVVVAGSAAGSTGSFGSGDGGRATAALLKFPRGVAFDSAGNLWVADQAVSGSAPAQSIRRVSAGSQTISTEVGRSAAVSVWGPFAELYNGTGTGLATTVMGLRADRSGRYLYYADPTYHRVRRVDTVTSNVDTIAGTGSKSSCGDGGPAALAGFSVVIGLAADAAGNVFVADGNRLRRVDAATGVVTTVVGNANPSAVYFGDGGPGKLAGFGNMYNIAVGPGGDVYMNDGGSVARIRVWNATTGNVTTLLGNGVYALNPATTNLNATPAANVTLQGTLAMVVAPDGALYYVDGGTNVAATAGYYQVRKYDPVNNTVQIVVGVGPPAARAANGGPLTSVFVDVIRNLHVAPDSSLLVVTQTELLRVNFTALTITKIAFTSGTATCLNGSPCPALSAAHTNGFFGSAMDRWGNVAVAMYGNPQAVMFYNATNGTVVRLGLGLCTPPPGGLNVQPFPVSALGLSTGSVAYAFLPDGSLLVADNANAVVYRLDRPSPDATVSVFAGGGSPPNACDGSLATRAALNDPQGVTVDAAGNVYVAETTGARVRRIDAATGVITTVVGSLKPLPGQTTPVGFAGDGGPASLGRLSSPQDLDTDGDLLFIADTGNARVRAVNLTSGVLTTFAGTGTGVGAPDGSRPTALVLYAPTGVAVDRAGKVLYVVETGANRVRALPYGAPAV